MSYRVVLLPGDGIGPEVASAMKACVDALKLDIEWDEIAVGEKVMERQGTLIPDDVLEAVHNSKIAIKGPITTPVGGGFRSVNVYLRHKLNLFACVRPIRFFPGTKALSHDINLVIFRENMEDLYAGIEFECGMDDTKKVIDHLNSLSEKKISDDSAVSIKPISISGTKRIAKAAFDYALKNGLKKVTIVHKANIMKFTDGLFLKTAREVGKEYEGKVECEDVIVDNMCMQLVRNPQKYDVLLLPNLYGDIISDLCAGLVGGLGLAPGANIGEDVALFEPVHGSAPSMAGKNLANPTAMILSAVMMLRYLGEIKAAKRLEDAVAKVIEEGKHVTYDLKSGRKDDPDAVGTKEMAEAIVAELG